MFIWWGECLSDPAALAAVDEKEFNGNWDFPEWKQGFPSVFPAEMDPARCLCSSSGCEGTQNPPEVLRVAVFAARWAGLGREGSSGHSSWPPWELLPLLRTIQTNLGLGRAQFGRLALSALWAGISALSEECGCCGVLTFISASKGAENPRGLPWTVCLLFVYLPSPVCAIKSPQRLWWALKRWFSFFVDSGENLPTVLSMNCKVPI